MTLSGRRSHTPSTSPQINILLALKHPNIVEVREMVVGSSIDKVFMVMEYCENDLKKCMQMQVTMIVPSILPHFVSYNTPPHYSYNPAAILLDGRVQAPHAAPPERSGVHAQELVHSPRSQDVEPAVLQQGIHHFL
jgi:serine/threonine protein kinase